MNNSPNSVTILPSHSHMLNITKEEEHNIKNHASIYKSGEDRFHSRNVTYILYI